MRQQYSQTEEADGEGGEASTSSSSTGPGRDLSLKEPIKLTLNTAVSGGPGAGGSYCADLGQEI